MVLLYDALTNRQPQSRALTFRFGGEKGLGDPRRQFGEIPIPVSAISVKTCEGSSGMPPRES